MATSACRMCDTSAQRPQSLPTLISGPPQQSSARIWLRDPLHSARGRLSHVGQTRLPEILQHHQAVLVTDWLRRQQEMLGHRAGSERDDRATAERFLKALGEASGTGNVTEPDRSRMERCRAAGRRLTGPCPPGVQLGGDGDLRLSLKQPPVRSAPSGGQGPGRLGRGDQATTLLLDRLGLYTTEVHQKTREEVIGRQRQRSCRSSRRPCAVVGWRAGASADRHTRQCPHPGGDGEPPPADRRHRSGSRHRHHRVPTVDTLVAQHLPQDGVRGPADGRRLHHQRHSSPDRPDDRPPGRRARRRDHQGDAGRRARDGAGPPGIGVGRAPGKA